ncbi:MAG: cupin domain-containing protein [Rubrobacter sp.]
MDAHPEPRPKAHPRVVSERDIKPSEVSHGERFGYSRKSLSTATGGEKLGCSLYEVPPGKQAWPRHYHLANEEAIFVVEGSGTLMIGDEEFTVSKGDYATFLAGEARAHRLVNNSDAPLKYLCFSTMNVPDVMVYPDSGKVGLFGGAAPGGDKEKRTFSKFLSTKEEVGYFDGEE